jgi:hypothetical protein
MSSAASANEAGLSTSAAPEFPGFGVGGGFRASASLANRGFARSAGVAMPEDGSSDMRKYVGCYVGCAVRLFSAQIRCQNAPKL